ncbi:transcriptional regulator, LacI family [Jannaschia faecimaris]|uniref:Transcriptional regulator, LacI family n=1 Tax=Jannaschia faecimaris TaxID=1244108 RepID=A0A1H3THQ5_9RHOB|nr:LacI family DNA-binding transcriptional regulator [Jannaschia faecimaris]SDZ49784.1 transcriptional regulator, LacI family [Jannaschia faecimaris]
MVRKTKPNLEDIARGAGVSKMTVSRVLRGGTGFSEDTRDKVMAEASRLNYLPDRLAAAFGKGGASTLVGVCVPRFTSSLFGQVIEALNANFARLGYQTMIGSHDQTPVEEEQWLQSLASWRPAGVLLAGTRHTIRTLELLRDLAVPVIEIWDLTTTPVDMAVGFSHHDSGYDMGRFMVSRGRRRIGYVGAMAGVDTMGRARQRGFRAALLDAGLDFAGIEVLHDRPSFYAGYVGTETILTRRRDLDGLYFHDDEMAIGGMAYLATKGIRVPENIGIAGWGAMEAASILPRRLTTTEIPAARLGKMAAEAMVMRLKGDAVQDIQLIPTPLVPGATV